jgi:hypothetical protein
MFYLGTTLLTLCFRPTFLAAKVRTTLFDVCHLFMETDRLPRQARAKHTTENSQNTRCVSREQEWSDPGYWVFLLFCPEKWVLLWYLLRGIHI